jgi:hypothetical protein
VTEVATPELDETFGRAARKVRLHLWLRRIFSSGAIGLAAGVPVAAGLWWFRQGELRPLSAVLGLVGIIVGARLAARRRWTDEEVALYLDDKLLTREQIVTAVGLREHDHEAAQLLKGYAAKSLALSSKRLPGPKVFDAPQLLAPIAAGVIAWFSTAPLPAAPAFTAPPGAERIQPKNVKGLERIEALRNQKGRSPEDDRRLKALADEAKKLRGDLSQGMEKRDALSRMAKLRDSIAELRSEFGNKQNRPGLEAAIGALAEYPGLRKAARALGDGDLTAFDQEMQRLANQAERAARDSAKQALEEAERAARQQGAQALADALEQQGQTFAKRAAEAEALRGLAKALEGHLDPDALEDLKEFGSTGDPDAARRLGDAMGKALSKLTEEERKRLAERLKEQLDGSPAGAMSPMSREELEDMARRLASPEGQKELEERLRALAESDSSGEAQRHGALDDAERGLGEAERGLGATPLPMPGGNPGSSPGNNPGSGPAGPGDNPGSGPSKGGPGSQKDRGAGPSDKIDAPELRSKADVKRSGSGPMHAATLGRAPARPGDTANQRGTGSLGSVAPTEIGAVEQSEVPEEYREHVGRYFEP